MTIYKSCYLLLYIAITLASGAKPNGYCCSPEDKLIRKRGGIILCWNEELNTTEVSTITHECKNRTFFGENMFSYRNDKYGNLLITVNGAYSSPNRMCLTNLTSMKNPSNVQLAWVVCEEEEKLLDENVMGYCLLVSAVFYFITAIIYCVLSELRDLQGKSFINFCAASTTGFTLMALMKIREYSDMGFCAAHGYFTYLFLMASFFWTNVISIQNLFQIRRPTVPDYSWKVFKWYFLYAWGCPIMLTVCTVIVNIQPGDHMKPGFGLSTCWYFDKFQQWIWMYSFLSILTIINIFIFIYISITLSRIKFSSNNVKAIRYKFRLTLKLFIIMGVPWVFEMTSTLSPQHIIWTIIDIFNILQGFLIFLILVAFRKKCLKAIHRRGLFYCLSGVIEKHLAVTDDDEDEAGHTDIPFEDRK